MQVVLYARVSSKDQEKEGFSIPAQLSPLARARRSKGFAIAQEFSDIETARESGRTNFTQMLLYLKKHHAVCRTILVEKTDRLYRNMKDYVTVDELEWRSTSSKRTKPSAAHLGPPNLAQENVKGMTEKSRAGIYPSYAPVGYKNIDGPIGKIVIVPDPDTALVIAELFDRFATGRHSVKSLVKELNSGDVKLRGWPLHKWVFIKS
jgi:site-specific DNA recombinase